MRNSNKEIHVIDVNFYVSVKCSFVIDFIDHFLNIFFMNIAYRYESRLHHGDYLPCPVVGLLVLL